MVGEYIYQQPTNRVKYPWGVKIFTDSELLEHRTRYMLTKPWICTCCNNHNYSMAGKHSHLKTKKHKRNYIRANKNN